MRDTNRLAETETFLAVVDEGSFSGAARLRRMTPSAVSKMMARLEARLNATLIRRTTRKLQLTEEGARLARSAREILGALDQAEREAGSGLVAGVVRIATSAAYANHVMAPILPELLAAHPELDLDLIISDGVTDLPGQPIDLAVRAGPLPDSSLRARSLGKARIVEVRAPGGAAWPLGFSYRRRDPMWRSDGARIRATDGNTLAQLAAHGCGAARVANFVAAAQLATGALEVVPGSEPGTEEFHIIYLGSARNLPARIAVVIDHLAAKGRVDGVPPHG